MVSGYGCFPGLAVLGYVDVMGAFFFGYTMGMGYEGRRACHGGSVIQTRNVRHEGVGAEGFRRLPAFYIVFLHGLW